MRTSVGLVAAVAAAFALAAPASAATTMSFGSGGSTVGSGKNFTAGTGATAVTVHATAWTSSSSSGNFATNSGHLAATLGQWSDGLGAQYGSSDEHTVDNKGSTRDYILLQFSTAVTLRNATFTTGWHDMNDTDATISYANVNYAAANTTYNSTGANFWNAAGAQLTANKYSSASVGRSGNSTRNINKPTLVTSNVWLISAKIGDVDTYKDSFKIKGITYDLPPGPPPPGDGAVPEPDTWAMLILGMGMVGGAMRRRNRARFAVA